MHDLSKYQQNANKQQRGAWAAQMELSTIRADCTGVEAHHSTMLPAFVCLRCVELKKKKKIAISFIGCHKCTCVKVKAPQRF